ncbi:MAG: c-type cytochrome biogenesis protein CcmI [Reyranellaceae bacterium]
MLAFALALLTAIAIVALAAPLLRPRGGGGQRLSYNLAVYRDQLAEIERDQKRGVLNRQQAEAARGEIERRLLALAQQQEAPARDSRALRRAMAGLAVVLPLVALGWYFATGSPELPARPFAERQAGEERMDNAARLLDELEKRLQAKPDDLQGWALLGRTALRVGRFDQAIAALARAIALAPERADLLASYAEALILKDQGRIAPRALEALDSALKLEPGEPAANYYRGLFDLQNGNPRATLERWLALEAKAAPDAPWLATLQTEIARVAQDSGIDPQSIRPDRKPPADSPPAAPRGPTAQDVERMAQLPAAEREAAIRAMVDGLQARLEETPEDVAGWQRLGRARLVLNEPDKAAAAFAEAVKRRPDDAQALGDLAEAQLRLDGIEAVPSPGTTATLRRLLAVQADNPLALFYLARVDAAAGNGKAARDKLARLLALVPQDAPQRAQIEELLKSLPE